VRYIDLDKLIMPDGWIARSNAAAIAVSGGADPNDYGDVWRDLKAGMLTISDAKCWYCESPVDRDDNAVDHFRPKNSVSDAAKKHLGYRWLAFDKSNFRLACTFCNSRRVDVLFGTSGGKADRFPLLDESKRVYSAGPIDEEEPLLLDPCNIEDCELLGCQQENGKPCASIQEAMSVKRVNTSIEIYHLDRDATCKKRHSIAVRLIADILEAKRLFDLYQADKTRKQDFYHVFKNIERTINKSAPYSGEMRYLLRGQRSEKHPWIRQLLEV
jgi:hypothetical protein